MASIQKLALASFAAAFSSLPAYAAGPGVEYVTTDRGIPGAVVKYSSGKIDFWPGERVISNVSNAVVVADRVPVTTSRGAIAVTSRSVVTARAIARGAAIVGRALPTVAPAIGIGQIVWNLLDDNRIRPDETGNLMLDPGVPTSDFEGMCWSYAGKCYTSPHEAASAFIAYQNAYPPTEETTFTLGACTIYSEGAANCAYTVTAPPSYSASLEFGVSGSITTMKGCPPPPASTGVVDRDGRCPTGAYTRSLTDDQVVDAITKDISDQEDKVPLVNDILGRPGGAVIPDSTTASGPSEQTGTPPAPETTTGPSGTVTRTESPTIAIRYRGSQVEWEPKTVTTTTPGAEPGDPDTEVVTTASDEPSADPGSAAKDFCIDNPKRAGCSELGDAEPPEFNPDEKPVELTPDAPWGGDSAACPPPRIINLGGVDYAWEWTLVCDFFSGIRFAVITAAWISAVMIFIGSRNDA